MNAKLERERLLSLIKFNAPTFGVTAVQTVENNNVQLLGGDLPAYFNKIDRKLIVWGRGNRWSGSPVDIETLLLVEKACQDWYDTLGN